MSSPNEELLPSERFAVDWFHERGYEASILARLSRRTIFSITDGAGNEYEFSLPFGVPLRDMPDHMELFNESVGGAFAGRNLKEVLP